MKSIWECKIMSFEININGEIKKIYDFDEVVDKLIDKGLWDKKEGQDFREMVLESAKITNSQKNKPIKNVLGNNK